MFENFQDWPEFQAFKSDVSKNWQEMREEALSLMNSNGFTPWKEPHLYEGKWDVYGIYWGGRETERHTGAPLTKQVLAPWQSIVFNAGFSLLRPGVKIKPHIGYTADVLRFHLGLSVPSTDAQVTGIRVGAETRPWVEGEAFLFDDTLEHEAWNVSDKPRIILLVDMLRPNGRHKRVAT